MSPHLRPLGVAPTFRHSRATPQDARLAGGSLVRMGPLRGQTTPSSQQECRTTLACGGAHGEIGSGSSPPLPPGVTAGSRVSRTPPPTRAEKQVGADVNKAAIRWKLTLFKAVHLERIIRAVGRDIGQGGKRHHQPNSGNAPERGSDGATPRLGSSTYPGTAAGVGRRATNSTPAEGLISSRTRARTRLAATISARSSDGGRGGELFTGIFRGVSPHQPTMERMESSTTHSQPAQSLPEQPPDTPGASQPPTTELVPPLTASLTLGDSSTPVIEGAPQTGDPPFPLEGSSTLVIEGAPLVGETPLQTSGPAQAPIFESRPPQPASRRESQSSIQPSLAVSVPASTPPTTPQLPSATSPSARPPTTSSPSPSPSLPPPQLPTTGHPSTATPRS